jgi:hypothetical protein
VTRSLSVTMPTDLLFPLVTTNELILFSVIFIAASWAELDAVIVTNFSVIISPIEEAMLIYDDM